MKQSWSGALLLVIGLVGAASAAESVTYKDEEWTILPESRWGTLSTKDFGLRFCVEGRWSQVRGSGILLYKSTIDTKQFLQIGAGPLKENLTAGLSGTSQKLERKRSVVRIFGKAAKGPQGTYLSVEQVFKLPDAGESYLERLGAAGDDPAKIAALARECAAETARYEDEDLAKVAQKIARRELEVLAKKLGPADHARRFELARRFEKEAADPASAIALYSLIYEAGDAPKELKAKVSDALLGLRAVRVHSGPESWSWVTYEEFKRSEGYLLRKPEQGEPYYIRRELAELLEVIALETERQTIKIDPPRQNPYKAGQDARTGKIIRGQTYAEVRAAAGSFPTRVYHRILPWGPKGRALWTQWELPSGGRIYFLSVETDDEGRIYFPPGEVVDRRPAGTPWPTE